MHRSLTECPKGKIQLGRPRRNSKIILKWIPKKMSGMIHQKYVEGSCEHGIRTTSVTAPCPRRALLHVVR
jgi:hypothetical protein